MPVDDLGERLITEPQRTAVTLVTLGHATVREPRRLSPLRPSHVASGATTRVPVAPPHTMSCFLIRMSCPERGL